MTLLHHLVLCFLRNQLLRIHTTSYSAGKCRTISQPLTLIIGKWFARIRRCHDVLKDRETAIHIFWVHYMGQVDQSSLDADPLLKNLTFDVGS